MKALLFTARLCLLATTISLFALVLGSTASHAVPAGSAWESCELKCGDNWNSCLNNGNPSGRCGRHYDGCLARCKDKYQRK